MQGPSSQKEKAVIDATEAVGGDSFEAYIRDNYEAYFDAHKKAGNKDLIRTVEKDGSITRSFATDEARKRFDSMMREEAAANYGAKYLARRSYLDRIASANANALVRAWNKMKRWIADVKAKDLATARLMERYTQSIAKYVGTTYAVESTMASVVRDRESEYDRIRWEQAVDGKMLEFIDSVNAMSDLNAISKRKYTIGEISDSHAELIENILHSELGIDINVHDYTINIDGSAINHIEERHGEKGSADHSMSKQDMARIGWAVNNAETADVVRKKDGSIDYSMQFKSKDGSPSPKIMLFKEIGNKQFVVVECVPDNVSKKLYVITAYKNKKGSNGQVLNMELKNSPQPTPKTPLDYSATTNSVAQNSENVKGFNKKTRFELKIGNETDSEGNRLSDGQRKFFEKSKVVDSDGNLLVVYHGSRTDFNAFDASKISNLWNMFGKGFYFTESKERASKYAHGVNLKSYYLNMENPLIEKSKEHLDLVYEAIGKTRKQIENYSIKNSIGGSELFRICYYLDDKGIEFSNIVKQLGFDGILSESYTGVEAVTYRSEQAKLTSNTEPTIDPDIRYALPSGTGYSRGQMSKIVANASKSKVYSKAEAEKAIDNVTALVSDLTSETNILRKADIRGKSRAEVGSALFT